MVRLNSDLPEFSNMIVQVGNSRLGWDQTRNLEIPGSREDACPGMTFQFLSKTRMRAQRQVTISVPRPALPAGARYAPLLVPARALPEIPPPVSAGFKPELS
jgi:hypothetical protein